jgi:SAM-dependent methyltransferase
MAEKVARSYELRPPYPSDLLTTLAALTVKPGAVLDLGCGLGDLARGLASKVDRVDAVDVSAAMIERGGTLPDGDSPNLRWIEGRAEEAILHPPYGLAVAGESLHWMAADIVLPRIRGALSSDAVLAIAGRGWGTGTAEEREIWVRLGRIGEWRPRDLIGELETRGLFERRGARRFTMDWAPTIDDYAVATRSRASYPVDPERAEAFDRALGELLGRLAGEDGRLRLVVTGEVTWGMPCPSRAS